MPAAFGLNAAATSRLKRNPGLRYATGTSESPKQSRMVFSRLRVFADAILALTNTRSREKTIRDCFGDSLVPVAYRRPGFRLSRDVAAAFNPNAAGIVLMNHGLITWG